MKTTQTETNHTVISFISLKQSYFLESKGSGSTFGELLRLFKHTTEAECFDYLIEAVQQNSPELKIRINDFLNVHSSAFPQLNTLRTFMKLLPKDDYFLILSGKVTDTAELMRYFGFLTRYHEERGMKQNIHDKFFDWGKTLANYNMHTFGHQRKKIGGRMNKEERVCIFCSTVNGKKNEYQSYVSFKNKSHAFSEALGNKNVINLDECDTCNERFSMSIERSMISFVSVFRSLYGLKGKGGSKKLVGENFVLDPIKGFDINYEGLIDINSDIHDIQTTLRLKDTFIPQDVYRCLVKFVLSVMEENLTENFTKALDWVNGKFDADYLPKVAFVQASSFYKEQSILGYYQKKTERKLPEMIGEFHYADMVFVFIIPFCQNEQLDYTNDKVYHAYWKEFNKIRSFHDWTLLELSGKQKKRIEINMNIEGINIGENAFVSYKETD